MLKTLALALALVVASVTSAAAGYLWKGDTVWAGSICEEPRTLLMLGEIYGRSIDDGNAAWASAMGRGACLELPTRLTFTLGDRLASWTMDDDGKIIEIEAWELLHENFADSVYAGFLAGTGDHDEPYEPGDTIDGIIPMNGNGGDATDEPIFAFVRVCSKASKTCLVLEDQWGPYPSVATCMVRLRTMESWVPENMHTYRLDGGYDYEGLCDTLARVREFHPGAYGGSVLGPTLEELGRDA